MIQVLRTVRKAVGPDYPVFIRFGADDLIAGGLTLDDGQYAAPRLVEAGADALDISGGHGGSRPEGAKPGYFVPLAVGIKAVTSVPVLVTGGITEPGFADEIIREGKADLVGVGRAMMADPEWGRKAVAALQ
jgi:2,4-dienoyl-CoA reductase-like NADH-dependent reductase (Old Yellow Enzyme family)